MDFDGGHDLHGPEEYGKDVYFTRQTTFGTTEISVVQTKAGNISMSSSKPGIGIATMIKQLQLALTTKVNVLEKRLQGFPSYVILCANGTISEGARRHILSEVTDPRIVFMDADVVIGLLDKHLPEFYFNVKASNHRYIDNLIQRLSGDTCIPVGGSNTAPEALINAATEDRYVDLNIYRSREVIIMRHGVARREQRYEQIKIRDVVERSERLILLFGNAGAGKSTCLRRAALILANRAFDNPTDPYLLPVMLRASQLAARSANLVDLCASEFSATAGESDMAFPTEMFSAGNVTIFVDGLDELANTEGRQAAIATIAEFNLRYPDCQIILASREYTEIRSLAELSSFATFRVAKIDLKQAHRLATRLMVKDSSRRLIPSEQFHMLSERVMRRISQIQGMELTPLLVAVFVATVEDGYEDIPANITELFRKYTELMLGRWERSKAVSQQYHAPLKMAILNAIAFDMHHNRRSSMPIDELKHRVSSFLADRALNAEIDVICREILFDSGLFRLSGDSIEFVHHVIQEFFAGLGIPHDDYVVRSIDDAWWRTAIVFYFGNKAGADADLERLAQVVAGLPEHELLSGGITLGLALQASFLTSKATKRAVYRVAIRAMSEGFTSYVRSLGQLEQFPNLAIIAYYFAGREASALSALREIGSEVWMDVELEEVGDDDVVRKNRERALFWLLVGLCETSNLTHVDKLIRKYAPADKRNLLAMHLAIYFAKEVRSLPREKKRLASRIEEALERRISGVRRQVVAEARQVQKKMIKGI